VKSLEHEKRISTVKLTSTIAVNSLCCRLGEAEAMKKVSFGVFLPFYAFQNEVALALLFPRIRDVVLECERLGYHSVWLDDHLMYGNKPLLECWSTLAALSAVTKRIRLGTMVTCASFRNPALLAKTAATVDVLSGARLEFGVGAGVQETEHRAYGFTFPTANARIERMKEAVEVIKALWSEEKASYTGKYYRVKDAVCEPKPLQKPHPPITIGGSGEKLLLKVTAQHADRYDWGYVPSITLYKHKLEVLESHCSAVGRDFQEIERSCWPGGQVVIARNKEELRGKIMHEKPKSVTLKDLERTSLIGNPDECVKQLQQYVDLGVTHFMLFFGDLPAFSSLGLFAETVANKMR
jgi:F420-dependent oxidoreductase-like protein